MAARLLHGLVRRIACLTALFVCSVTLYAQTGLAVLTPGTITTYVGGGTALGDGGAATSAKLSGPRSIVFDGAGNLYIADYSNQRVRKVTPASNGGIITTFAGGATAVCAASTDAMGDGCPATAAILKGPAALAFNPAGTLLYVVDAAANDVRVINLSTGNINLLGGTGTAGDTGDGGAATLATFSAPDGVAVDAAGNIYVADGANNRIRKISTTGTTTGTITAFAGTGTACAPTTAACGDGGQALSTAAAFSTPYHMSFDSAGNLYIADFGGQRIRMVSANGVLSTVAGTGAAGFTGDSGLATMAKLHYPRSVNIDAAGDLLITDGTNNRVRRVDTAGIITTIAGGATVVCATNTDTMGDGCPATQATLNSPFQIALDAAGNLYLDDYSNSLIRKISVGTPTLAFGSQGVNTSSAVQVVTLSNNGAGHLQLSGQLISGAGFALVASGGTTDCTATINLAPGASCQIGIQFSPTATGAVSGTVTLTNDSGGVSGAQQTISLTATGILPTPTVNLTVTPSSVPVGSPVTIAVSVANTAFPAAGTPTGTVAITNGGSVLNTLTLVNGSASYSPTLPRGNYSIVAQYSGDSHFNSVSSTAVALSILGTNTIAALSAAVPTVAQGASDRLTATVSSTVGVPTGTVTFADNLGTLGVVNLVNGVATFDAYFASTGTHVVTATYSGDPQYNPSTSPNTFVIVNSGVVASITPALITTFAGNGTAGSTGDGGLATAATLNAPVGTVGVDSSGNIYISDTGGQRVRKVTPAGIISTIAGTGAAGHTGDGAAATAATLHSPGGVAVDATGNIFILDSGNNDIRKIDTTGTITTFAGVPSTTALADSGDGGPATAATLYNPRGVAVGPDGTVYIAEYSGAVIRAVSPAGTISTVAGTGVAGSTGTGGAAILARLSNPNGVAVDAQGNLYIAESSASQVRKVLASTGTIVAYAGTGTSGYSGDGGLATAAQVSGVRSVSVDAAGNVYIADTTNNRIRKIDGDGYISTIAGSGVSGYAGDGGSAVAAQLGQPYGITVDSIGNLYIAGDTFNVIRKLTTASGFVDFGSLPYNTSAQATVTLGNSGTLSLALSAISITGTGFSESAPTTRGCTTSTTLAAGSACQLTVTFSPTTLGPFNGTLTFTDNAGAPQTVTLVGTGTRLPSVVSLFTTPPNYATPGTPVSLTAKVAAGSTSSTVPTGSVQFLSGTTVLGSSSVDSTGTATFPLGSTLVPGTYQFTAVYLGDTNFQPATSGNVTFGVQNDFSLTLSPSSGQTKPGGSLTTTLTITPAGLAPGTFQLACANQPAYIVCSFSPATLTPSTSTMTSVLTITANAPPVGKSSLSIFEALSGLILLILTGVKRRSALRTLLSLLLLTALATASGCGSSLSPSPVPVPVTVTVTSAQATHTAVYTVNFY